MSRALQPHYDYSTLAAEGNRYLDRALHNLTTAYALMRPTRRSRRLPHLLRISRLELAHVLIVRARMQVRIARDFWVDAAQVAARPVDDASRGSGELNQPMGGALEGRDASSPALPRGGWQ